MLELTPYRSYNCIPQSKSMHIMPRRHIETDRSTSSYLFTLSLEYPKAPCLIWILVSVVRSLIGLSFLKAIQYLKYINIAHAMVKFWKQFDRRGVCERTVKDTAAGELTPHSCPVFPQLANGTGPNRTRVHGSLLTFITIADAMVNNGMGLTE